MSDHVKLIDALMNAGQQDLDDVEAEVIEARKRIAALQTLQRVLSCKVNGTAEKMNAARKKNAEAAATSSGGETDRRRDRVAKYLLFSGLTKQRTLCEKLDIPEGSITKVLKHDWFNTTPNGVTLTSAGAKHAETLRNKDDED